MYSRRLRQPCFLLRSKASEEPGEIGSGELPFERLRHDLVVGLEGKDVGGKVVEGGDVRRREDFALEDGEVDLGPIVSGWATIGESVTTSGPGQGRIVE